MRLLKNLENTFSAMQSRERVLVIVAFSMALLVTGTFFIKPQFKTLSTHENHEAAIHKDISLLKKRLADLKAEDNAGIDPYATERAQVTAMRARIAEFQNFMKQADSSTAQIGNLVRTLVKNNTQLSLISLKTLPGNIFYSPPAPAPEKAPTSQALEEIVKKVKREQEKLQPQIVLIKKTLYRHGVDVVVKGRFPALMGYIDEMQRYPFRIFWSEAKLDASSYPEATLRLVIFTLSDQPTAQLN